MKVLRTLPVVLVLAIAAPSAHAYTQKESDVLLNVSYAVATAGQKNRKGAEAFCRQAKGLLKANKQDAYLAAHIERCYGAVAATLDETKTACTRYKRALEIWQKTPPPNDHPQSVASREQLRDGMIRYRKEKCGVT